MPVLPDISARRRAPQSRQGIVSDPTAGLVAETVSGVARQAQSVVNQIQQQQDDLSYAQAKADMVVADIDARAGLEGRTDHAEFLKSYSESMDAARTKALSLIGNQRDRARFEIEDKLFRARNNELVAKHTRGLARDERRATLTASLEALRDGALVDTAAGSDVLAVQTARGLINASVVAGDHGAEEGLALKDTWSEGYAVARIEMLPFEEQIAALEAKGTTVEEIDPDRRQAMLNTAISGATTQENQAVTLRNQQRVETDRIQKIADTGVLRDIYFDTEMSDEEKMDAFEGIKNSTHLTTTQVVKAEAFLRGDDAGSDNEQIVASVKTAIWRGEIQTIDQMIDYVGEGVSHETFANELLPLLDARKDEVLSEVMNEYRARLGVGGSMIFQDANASTRKAAEFESRMLRERRLNPDADPYEQAEKIFKEVAARGSAGSALALPQLTEAYRTAVASGDPEDIANARTVLTTVLIDAQMVDAITASQPGFDPLSIIEGARNE